MHGDLDLSDFCEGSDWRAVLDGWAGFVGFGWTWPLDPKTKECWAILGQSEQGQSCNFPTTLSNMAAGGKAYASRSSHGRLNASTTMVRVSGTGDTNRCNLLLNLVANRSIWGRCHLLQIVWKTSGSREHSVWMVWPSLDSWSTTTLSAWNVSCFESYLSSGTPGQDSS